MEGLWCDGVIYSTVDTHLVSFGARRPLLSWVTLRREDREFKPCKGHAVLVDSTWFSCNDIYKKQQQRDKRTGGPSAPGIPGKPGFPVGPWWRRQGGHEWKSRGWWYCTWNLMITAMKHHKKNKYAIFSTINVLNIVLLPGYKYSHGWLTWMY